MERQLDIIGIQMDLGASKRGVAMGPGETLRQVYDDRIPRYEAAADVTIPCEGKEVDDIVAEIMAQTKDLL